ncbi:DUF427 domain-containing protein [Pseudonocardia sp. TRM90224]|uniref:DUF427 domain-containing protein n=1 Tax=Pseudonocardia sp. TRM90224 TaxID=2812678 RepID=UPI001E427677|nr:DUF427 domain-containing protein [Pseudonocardia sp. TRM90224]
MATQLSELLFQHLEALRFEPAQKRVRAHLDGEPVCDTTAAVLVWEPRRVVPQYAVPAADVIAELTPAGPADLDTHGPDGQPLGPGGRTVLTPDTGFGAHSCDGVPLTVRAGDAARPGAAFRPADPDLAGYVLLDFAAFGWIEEEEPIVSHPRDPFHRVDVRESSRHVRIELEGVLLAESRRPLLLFETSLPPRYYFPPGDVHDELLGPSDTTTACAYKGVAQYRSALLPGGPVADMAWSYPQPLADAVQIAEHVAFFAERCDVTLDGVALDRPRTPWS